MKKRFLSLIIALAMMVGVFTPLIANAADTKPEEKTEKVTKTVTLHKLIMKPEELKNWDKKFSDELEKKGYNATQDTDALKVLLGTGHSAHEVAGVYFAVKDSAGKFVTIKTDTKTAVKPTYGTVDSLDATLPDGYELLAGETKDKGIEFNTKGLKGEYTIEEIHEKSSYYNNSKDEKENGKIITDSKAVPVKITLPLVNNDGVVENAHVYPKNTEDKPQIDKNFLKNNELTAAEQEAADKLKVGADYENYKAKKATAKAEIGKKIPYEVKTEIPAKSNLADAHWDDKMTEGLTFNKDLEVKIDNITYKTLGKNETASETLKAITDIATLKEDGRGFSLRLNKTGLGLINGKEKAVTVELKYSATVNSKAIADIPDANDITFHYGNTPSKGNTPKPTKPNDNGEVTVEKTWGGKDSDWAEGEYAKFKLVDANTGEDVKAEDLDTVADYTFESEVTLQKGGKTSYTWKGLKKDKSYKVVETESKTLSDAEYTVNEQGKIEVTDHKSNNPKPLNPTEPKVVTGGKRFVKTNDVDGDKAERLAGAEFYVKKTVEGVDKYLVATAPADEKTVKTAKTALDTAVDKYNNMDAETQKSEEGQKAKADVDAKQKAYNEAVLANATAYTWGKKDDTNVVILTSDEQGRFEITGLEYGSYKLEEKTAPKGYATLNYEPTFTVEKGSYAGATGEFKYEKEVKTGETQHYGIQIKNKKVTIPQTGGIGTIIFTAIGLAIMASAVIAIKKRQATEAR